MTSEVDYNYRRGMFNRVTRKYSLSNSNNKIIVSLMEYFKRTTGRIQIDLIQFKQGLLSSS